MIHHWIHNYITSCTIVQVICAQHSMCRVNVMIIKSIVTATTSTVIKLLLNNNQLIKVLPSLPTHLLNERLWVHDSNKAYPPLNSTSRLVHKIIHYRNATLMDLPPHHKWLAEMQLKVIHTPLTGMSIALTLNCTNRISSIKVAHFIVQMTKNTRSCLVTILM